MQVPRRQQENFDTGADSPLNYVLEQDNMSERTLTKLAKPLLALAPSSGEAASLL
jgi:hypothetical protein